MKLLLIVGLCALQAGSAQAEEKEGDRFREIRLRVLDLDGRPAAKRQLNLHGLSRGAMFGEPPWSYTTDDEGRAKVRLFQLHTWEDEKQRPGWGNYAVTVTPEEGRDAGAVTPIVMNVGEIDGSTYGGNRGANCWGVPIRMPDGGIDLTVQITRGVVIEGTVWDYEEPEKALAGVSVSLCHDLSSETHTGYGGEILQQCTMTDENGRYRFAHVYPRPFILNPTGSNNGIPDADYYWLRTKVDDKPWREEAIYQIVPSFYGSTGIDVGVTKKKLFRYFGKVADPSGAPIKDVKVTFGVSFHKEPETHLDHHHFLDTTTDTDGSYEILLPTPWITGMSAAIDEKTRDDRWEGGYAPGEYNFQLKR